MSRIVVLRLGHRPLRDKRVTTHVGLVARAFGADGMIIAGAKDKSLEESIRKAVEIWGGPFFIKSGEKWKDIIKGWKSSGGLVVHLTMYGLPVDEVSGSLCGKDLLLVVGAEKVPSEVFDMADFNASVGSQPHSEIAALAVLLDRVFKGAELKKEFKGKLKIVPDARGKRIERA
jgi:tRNA (cytidine56-2'-O)-methyltransferase